MHWIYILLCEDDYIYIGETTRLFRRFWEHMKGNGGLNTSIYRPIKILAIYSVDKLGKFFRYVQKINMNDFNLGYNIFFDRGGILETFSDIDDEMLEDHLFVENSVTEKLMIDNEKSWEKIRGGKYVKFDIEYQFPQNDFVGELPNCKCNLPCDVRKNEKEGYLYFRCARKNMWTNLRDEFDTDDPCDFFLKFTKDEKFREVYERRKSAIKILINKSLWLHNIPSTECVEYCIGNCGRSYDSDYCVQYNRRAINLCFDCFIKDYRVLEAKYSNIKTEYTDSSAVLNNPNNLHVLEKLKKINTNV